MEELCPASAGKLMGNTEALVEQGLEASRMVNAGALGEQRIDESA